MVDKVYAMSSFLQFRTVYDSKIRFAKNIGVPRKKYYCKNRTQINTSMELYNYIKSYIEHEVKGCKAALALSSGIDSAIMAKFMPKGSIAYTFKCVVPDVDVTDETIKAKLICEENGLEHRIIEIYWEDFDKYIPILMKNKNAPIHSIEVQIYKAALQAKQDGFDKMIFGESADIVFGGIDKLLLKDYTLGEFVERYSFVMPYKALKEHVVITEPYKLWCKNDGYMDTHGFINNVFYAEAINTYQNACESANIAYLSAFSTLTHNSLDIARIRRGDSKYLVREVFKHLYPNSIKTPEKIPMPRPMEEWFKNWGGPRRPEFWPNCHINMTGDQKYYIWILEKFLDQIERDS